MNILYLVHDLSDAAVARRITMLRDGGATVTVGGFRRGETAPTTVAGAKAIDLGRTYNGGFAQRILSVLREIVLLPRRRALFAESDIVIARTLEMLAIGVRGRSLCTKPPVLVYESLDIHRLLLNEGPIGKILRGLEGWLSRRARALITSSPAFITEYFEKRSSVRLPVTLIENKVYTPVLPVTAWPARKPGPPWRIGWFGAIRCRKSLGILAALARQGAAEVIIRGRPALDQIPDFHAVVDATPGLSFEGPYKNPDDLATIYRDIHFTWAIDMFEEGLNSSWLLPNRVYEGGMFGTVPISQQGVETNRFLQRLGLGVTLTAPLEASLGDFFRHLTNISYEKLEKSAMEMPAATWCTDKAYCEVLISYLNTLKN